MIYRVFYRRVVITTLFFGFCFLFSLILPPDVHESRTVTFSKPTYVKRTRVVQAVAESSDEMDSIPTRKRSNVAWVQLTPDSQRSGEDYDDGNGIVDDYNDDDDLPENDVFRKGDFDYDAGVDRESMRRNLEGPENRTRTTVPIVPVPSPVILQRLGGRRSLGTKRKWTVSKSLSPGRTKIAATFERMSSQKGSSKSTGHFFQVPFHRSHEMVPRNITMSASLGMPLVEDGIFWSEELEAAAPKGVQDEEVTEILHQLRHLNVQQVQPPTWNRCGRPKNQFLAFEGGSKACARYRSPHQYLVHGEVLSFYLSRLLGVHNVPVVALSSTRDDQRWNAQHIHEGMRKSEWDRNTTVALIQWIDNLERDRMPALLLSSLLTNQTLSARTNGLTTIKIQKLTELLQWSDLIVFDYITGNYDRVASMQDAADKENRPSILQETIHNLVRSKFTGGIWLIDNESGLLDSYSLLYGRPGHDGRFLTFHHHMLGTMCIFRRSTVERVRWLHEKGQAGSILMDFVKEYEPLFPPTMDVSVMEKRIQERVDEVYDHMMKCKSRV